MLSIIFFFKCYFIGNCIILFVLCVFLVYFNIFMNYFEFFVIKEVLCLNKFSICSIFYFFYWCICIVLAIF